MAGLKFPSETNQYRAARKKLLDAELGLRRQVEKVAALRRKLPTGGEAPQDYVFTSQQGPLKLSGLFERGSTLLAYSFMYGPRMKSACPMCTSFLDALDGNAQHLAQARMRRAPPRRRGRRGGSSTPAMLDVASPGVERLVVDRKHAAFAAALAAVPGQRLFRRVRYYGVPRECLRAHGGDERPRLAQAARDASSRRQSRRGTAASRRGARARRSRRSSESRCAAR